MNETKLTEEEKNDLLNKDEDVRPKEGGLNEVLVESKALETEGQTEGEGPGETSGPGEETTGSSEATGNESEAPEGQVAKPTALAPVDTTPNVKFVGTRRDPKNEGKKVRQTEAPEKLISGPATFEGLPDSETQLEGFYYERAAELCRAFPGLYKKIIKKGE